MASPAETHCSELDYLIALQQSEESFSQVRRSQRLREREEARIEAPPIPYVGGSIDASTTVRGVPSPDLFVGIQEELSHLSQVPPNQALIPDNNDRKRVLENIAENVDIKMPPVKQRRRGRPRANAGHTARKPRKLRLSRSRARKKKVEIETVQDQLQQEAQPPPLHPNSHPSLPAECYFYYNLPEVPSIPLINTNSQLCSYQRLNLTQTILPERYPAHFVHQLPPEADSMNGTIKSEELQRVQNPGHTQTMPVTELRRICPTPDTTPTVVHERQTPTSPLADSTLSTTPSLSESLADIFGTNKIRNILNIEPPRKYLLMEHQLPVIAFMLNVDVTRLRAVLDMTQRLTLEQMQQMAKGPRDVITIDSTSEEESP